MSADTEADLIRRRVITVAAQLIAIANIADADARSGRGDAQALANTFAWAIDGARNALPTQTAVSTVLGLHDPDLYGKLPDHVVALTEDEIETLHSGHVYAAKQCRPRKRQKQTEREAHRFAWFTARAALFERLLPQDDEPPEHDPDAVRQNGEMIAGNVMSDEPHPIYDDHGALVDMGGGKMDFDA